MTVFFRALLACFGCIYTVQARRLTLTDEDIGKSLLVSNERLGESVPSRTDPREAVALILLASNPAAALKLTPSLGRRAVLAGTAALFSRPDRAPAAESAAIPTFSFKGLPGVSNLVGADKPRPTEELGVIGRGKNNDQSGRLNYCDKKGCISTYSSPYDDSFIPPWSYDAEDQTGEFSGFLKADNPSKPARKKKTVEEAQKELSAVVAAYPGANIIQEKPRYLYAEFEDLTTGEKDDVEFLISLDSALVGYRFAPRGRRNDDKKQRERVRSLRKSLEPNGWKSVGRAVNVN
jgi:hypothetical protein